DGIRDFHVTGVQTCALPIFAFRGAEGVGLTDKTSYFAHVDGNKVSLYDTLDHAKAGGTDGRADLTEAKEPSGAYTLTAGVGGGKIGRASCRERVERAVGGVW